MQSPSPSANPDRIRTRGVHPTIPILMMIYLLVGFAYAFGFSVFLGKAWPMAIYFLGLPFGVFVILKRVLLVTFTGWPNVLAVVYALIGTVLLIAGAVPHSAHAMGWAAILIVSGLLTWGPIIGIVWLIAKAAGQRRRSMQADEHAAFVEALVTEHHPESTEPDADDSAAWGIRAG